MSDRMDNKQKAIVSQQDSENKEDKLSTDIQKIVRSVESNALKEDVKLKQTSVLSIDQTENGFSNDSDVTNTFEMIGRLKSMLTEEFDEQEKYRRKHKSEDISVITDGDNSGAQIKLSKEIIENPSDAVSTDIETKEQAKEGARKEETKEETKSTETQKDIVVSEKNETCSPQNDDKDSNGSDIPDTTVKQDTERPVVTLEEKRKKQIENKITIEEKRKLQQKNKGVKQNNIQKTTNPYASFFQKITVGDSLLFIMLGLCLLLGGYIAVQLNRYFSIWLSIFFFFVVIILVSGVCLLIVKKKRLAVFCNVLLSLLLSFVSLGVYRISKFSDKVFDNTESETVMIVAKKDSLISESDDFFGKRIAMVKADAELNRFAEEMLATKGKIGYQKEEYKSYLQAYEQLMSGTVDLMVYSNQARQRLSEDEIDSWANIKVLFQEKRERQAVVSKNVDIRNDPFNILVSGVDLTSENINEKGSSDVNILVSVNPKSHKVLMQVVPRDAWTALPCVNGEHTKLTYAGAYGGIDCSIKAIEQYLNVEINYYAKINFQGVMDLVDAMGGITVQNDIAFCTTYQDRYDNSSEICFQAGENRIDGAQALIYSRVRKIFTDGDIARGRHQMAVINGVIQEFKKSPSFTYLNSLMDAVENNFTTNLTEDEIITALEIFLSMRDELSHIESYTMNGEMRWNDDEVTGEYLYYFYPYEGELDLVKERIENIQRMPEFE